MTNDGRDILLNENIVESRGNRSIWGRDNVVNSPNAQQSC